MRPFALRPLALACLLAGAAPAAQAANCNAADETQLNACITGAVAGDTITLTGSIALTGSLPALAAGTSILANGFTLSGSGDLALGNGTYSSSASATLSNTSVSAGAGQTGTLTAAAGTTLTVATGGSPGVTVAGTGTLVAGSATQTGTVAITSSIGGSGTVQVSGGTLALSGANTYFGTTNVNSGTLAIAAGSSAGSGVLNINGAKVVTLGNVTLANSSLSFGAGQTGTLAAAGGTTMTYNGSLLMGANSVAVFGEAGNAGTLDLAIGGATLPASASIRVAAGTVIGNLTFGVATNVFSSTTVDAGAALQFTGSAAIKNLQGAGTVTGSGTLAVQGGNFSGSITGATDLNKANTGTLVLSGASTYTGATQVNGGTLQAGAANVLSGSTAMTVAGGATFSLNGFDQAIGSLTGAGTVDLGSGVLTSGGNNTSTAFSGVLQGGGALTKSGIGTLTLTGANTYGGVTTISGGTLDVGGGGGSGTLGTGNVVNNGALVFDRFDIVTVANAISGSGSLTQTGGGTLTLTGNNTYTGTTTVNAANSLRIGNGGTTGSLGTGAVINNNVLSFNRSNTFGVANDISGSGRIVLLGGTAILTGTNTYAGTTTLVSGSTLQVGNGGTAGTLGAGAVSNDGALVFNRSNTYTVANNISESFGGTGTLTQAGTGNLVLTGTNSFTGGISVNSGTLSVNGATTGNATVSSGAVLGGSGTVTGNVNVMSGGVLAPGNSIGTLTVSGNLTFAAGSVYRVETDAAGNADRVNVIGAPGTLTINGGTVDVRAGAGNYARNTQYTILTSTGGRTGTFAGATSNLAFLTPTLVYDANSVYLNLLASETASYGSVARTANQGSVANYLNAFAGNPGNAQASALIRQIDNLSADQARNAFDALSGSQHASATQSALAGSRGFGDALGARVGSAGGNGGFGGFGGVSTLRGSAFGLGAMPWGASADAPLQLAGMFAGGAPLAASPSRGGGASSVSPSVSSSASSPAFPSASSSPSGSSGAPAASPGLSSGTAPPAAAGLRDTGAAASGDAGGFGLTRANWGANTAGQNGLWAQALGSGGRIESDGNGAGHSYRAGGFLVGYDRALGDKWLIGAAGGYNRANWDAATLGVAPGTGKVETPQGAVYARYTGGAWMAAFSGSYADHKFDTSRTVAIGTGSSTATSSHRGLEWGLNATVEYALGAGAWQLRPLAGLRYTRLREEAFAESGAAGGSLTIDARTTESTTLSGGVRVLRAFNPGGSRQDAAADGGIELRAVYSHLFGENNAPIVARLAGQSASFTALGSPLKRDALTLGAGVSAKIGHGFTGYADVSYEVRGSGQDAYAIGAGVKYLW